jgi:hypothetical protein
MIEVIHKQDANGKGKTQQLIEKCYEARGVFVCSDEFRKERIIKESMGLGTPLSHVYTINELFYEKEFKRKLYFFEDVHYLIKNLFSSVMIGAMSINVNEGEDDNT